MIRFIKRELRSLRNHFIIIIGAIALGVAAITSVHALGDSVREGIRVESRPMMAADIVVRSMHSFPDEYFNIQSDKTSQTKEMLSMAATKNGQSLLIELKAVSSKYPLYGELDIEPQQVTPATLADDQVIVQNSLLRRLELRVGDQIMLNGIDFTIAGVVLAEPDRLNAGLNSGPRVMISTQGFARSKLEQFGSRITHRIQWKAPDKESRTDITNRLETLQEEHSYVRVQNANEGLASASRSIDNTERFLSLLALFSMLIGLIGVVQSIQTWLTKRRRTIATFRCLGVSNGELVRLYCSVVLIISTIGAGIGIAISSVGVVWLVSLVESYLPVKIVPQMTMGTIFEGLLLGIGTSLLVVLPTLRKNLRIPPLAALRADVQPEPATFIERFAWAALFLTMLFGLALWQADSAQIAGFFVGGIILVAIILAAISYGCARLFGRIRFKNWVFRQAASSFRRPGFGVSSAMVALGLGLMVVVTIAMVQRTIESQLSDISLSKAPTNFMIDIQNDQWPDVQKFAQQNNARYLQSAPVIMARLAAINGQSISEITKDKPEADKWAFTREQRLSYDQVIDSDTILEGQFGQKAANNELCMEVRYAERLGLTVGDSVTFNVQGIPVDFQITALRRIQWESFNINFFIVGEAELLQDMPQFRLAAAQMDVTDEETLQQNLTESYPNVTMISLRAIISRVSTVLENIVLVIQSMGLFSVAAGVVILIGTLQTTAMRRENQIRLLYTLGATAREIRTMVAVEFAIIGILASLVGVLVATALSWAILSYGFRLSFTPSLFDIFFWFAIGTTVSVVAGILVTRGQIKSVIK